ncbi:MAG: response regulator [Ruminiclostridium sp.]
MLHKNILQRIICLLIALSFVMLYIPVSAESAPEIIRVGYVANGSIFTFDEEGNVKGYETVLLDEIAKRNNWQYEYVGGTLDEIMEMLDNGQLDLVCHVKKNADREQKYLFSDFVAGIETGALCCRAEDGRFFYNDFSSFEGMRVAMLKGNYFNTKLAEFAGKSGFSYIPCQYDSYTECYDALKKGAADGIVIGALVVDPECRILSCFCSEPFYFITGKHNDEFMRRLDSTVSEINRSGNDAYLRFAVADTGCGMSDDMLGRVFKPFEQESSDSAKKHTGSGLGLSIAKNLVDMMQGAISVRSQNGKGTTFTVDLPFGLTGKTGGEKNAINAPAVSEKQYDFTGYKVILAEDNEFNAEIARDLLELVNMGVDAAENGIEAVKLFESNPPRTYCCILMDLQMPEMGGLDAARKIRSLDRNDAGEIPIYAMTANTYAEDITASLSAGMNGHIAKPIDVDMLYRTLEKAIEGTAAPLNP